MGISRTAEGTFYANFDYANDVENCWTIYFCSFYELVHKFRTEKETPYDWLVRERINPLTLVE